jgi:hypothetical protein
VQVLVEPADGGGELEVGQEDAGEAWDDAAVFAAGLADQQAARAAGGLRGDGQDAGHGTSFGGGAAARSREEWQ